MKRATTIAVTSLFVVVVGVALGGLHGREPPSDSSNSAATTRAIPAPAPNSGVIDVRPEPYKTSTGQRDPVAAGAVPAAIRKGRQDFGLTVSNAISSQRAPDSLTAARILAECARVDSQVERYRAKSNENVGVNHDNSAFLAALQNSEATQRRCQSVTADQRGKYLSLLEIAAKGGAMGAAADYYVKSPVKAAELSTAAPWLPPALMRDANNGDIGAMRIMACEQVGASLANTQRATYFAAIQQAAKGSGMVASYASMIVEYCSQKPSEADVDVSMLKKLMTAIANAGESYIFE